MNELLAKQIARNPIRTQADACAVAVRRSIAAFGPVHEELIIPTARGLAQGLFGEAFESAIKEQQNAWIALCEKEYRKALSLTGQLERKEEENG